jgi:hypothetical protein
MTYNCFYCKSEIKPNNNEVVDVYASATCWNCNIPVYHYYVYNELDYLVMNVDINSREYKVRIYTLTSGCMISYIKLDTADLISWEQQVTYLYTNVFNPDNLEQKLKTILTFL